MGHANHAAIAAAVSWSNTSRIVTVPETGMITCALSPGVEKTVGRPMSTTTAKTASNHEYLDKAQGVATQATSSAAKRRTDAMRSSGLSTLSMFAPPTSCADHQREILRPQIGRASCRERV